MWHIDRQWRVWYTTPQPYTEYTYQESVEMDAEHNRLHEMQAVSWYIGEYIAQAPAFRQWLRATATCHDLSLTELREMEA